MDHLWVYKFEIWHVAQFCPKERACRRLRSKPPKNFGSATLHFRFLQELSVECSSDGARSTGSSLPWGRLLHSSCVYSALLLLHCLLHTHLCVSVRSSLPWGPLALTNVHCAFCTSLFAPWQHCALCAFSPRKRLLLHAHFCILHSAILYLHCICIHIQAQVHCSPLGGASCYKAHFCSRVTAFYISFSLLSASHFQSQINQALGSLF